VNYVLIVLGILLLLATGAASWQYQRANGLQEALATSESARAADQATAKMANERNQQTIRELQAASIQNQIDLGLYAMRQQEIASENDRLRIAADKWRSRLDDETIKRPKVVARAARRAINSGMRRAECITDPDCDPNPDRNPGVDSPSASEGKQSGSPAANRNDAADRKADGNSGRGGGVSTVRPDVLRDTGSPDVSQLGERANSVISVISGFGRGIRGPDTEAAGGR
jgi:regulator of replication initiation timing